MQVVIIHVESSDGNIQKNSVRIYIQSALCIYRLNLVNFAVSLKNFKIDRRELKTQISIFTTSHPVQNHYLNLKRFHLKNINYVKKGNHEIKVSQPYI